MEKCEKISSEMACVINELTSETQVDDGDNDNSYIMKQPALLNARFALSLFFHYNSCLVLAIYNVTRVLLSWVHSNHWLVRDRDHHSVNPDYMFTLCVKSFISPGIDI